MTVIDLADGALHALCNPYVVDGRVSWHPPEARGVAPMNSYVLKAGNRALLVDSGISVHRDALLEQLGRVIDPSTELAIVHTRVGEYSSICNTVPIADHFSVATVYDTHDDAPLWVDFCPGLGRDRPGGELGRLGGATVALYGGEDSIDVGDPGVRRVEIFPATLRLLPTSWIYDRHTRTLFTSDSFTHVMRDDATGPWIVTAADDSSTLEQMRRHMFSTRYWWLPGARTDEIRSQLAITFERYEVETIAPGYGCVLHGRDVVARHREMLDVILAEAQDMPPAAVDLLEASA